jgi:hypothetical protein
MITCESSLTLNESESFAFASSNLKLIEIPVSSLLIDQFAFYNLSSRSLVISVESNHFRVEQTFIEANCGSQLVGSFGDLAIAEIAKSIEILCCVCFFACESLELTQFDSRSRLKRIESSAFAWSSLKQIDIPTSIEILCDQCFSGCKTLDAITFDSKSRLHRIESLAFALSSLKQIDIPTSVEIFL